MFVALTWEKFLHNRFSRNWKLTRILQGEKLRVWSVLCSKKMQTSRVVLLLGSSLEIFLHSKNRGTFKWRYSICLKPYRFKVLKPTGKALFFSLTKNYHSILLISIWQKFYLNITQSTCCHTNSWCCRVQIIRIIILQIWFRPTIMSFTD